MRYVFKFSAKPTVHIEAIPCFGATCYTPSVSYIYYELEAMVK